MIKSDQKADSWSTTEVVVCTTALLALTVSYLCLPQISHWQDNIHTVLSLLAIAALSYSLSSVILFTKGNRSLGWALVTLGFGLKLICSLSSVAHPQLLSSDLYRYLWEGEVVAAGLSPYRYAPDAAELQALAEIHAPAYAKVEHKALPALYPPAAQFLFAASAGDEWSLRILSLVFELLLCLILLRWLDQRQLPCGRIALYLFSPISVFELSMAVHLDVFFLGPMVFGVVLAERARTRRQWFVALAILSFACMLKQTAVVALGFVVLRLCSRRDVSWRDRLLLLLTPVVIASILYGPFLLQGSVWGSAAHFAQHWRFNGHLFYFLESLFQHYSAEMASMSAKALSACLVAALYWRLRGGSPELVLAVLFAAIYTLSPVRYPWYCAAMLVWLPLLSSAGLVAVLASYSLLAFTSYTVWIHPQEWEIGLPLGIVQLVPLALLPLLYWGESRFWITKPRESLS